MKSLLYHSLDTLIWRITIAYHIFLDYTEVLAKPYNKYTHSRFFTYLGGFHHGSSTPWDFFLKYQDTGRLIWTGTKWQLDDVVFTDWDEMLDKIIDDILKIKENMNKKGYKI